MTTVTDNPFITDIARGEQTAVLAWRHWLEERADWGDVAAKARLELCGLQEDAERATCIDPDAYPHASCYRKGCDRCRILARSAALLRENEATWRASGPCEKCDGSGACPPHSGRATAPRCLSCYGTGDRGGLLRQLPIEDEYGAVRGESEARIHWRAGLPYAVECRLEDVLERTGYMMGFTGQGTGPIWGVTEWAKSVVRWHPVERFVLTDKNTWVSSVEWTWLDERHAQHEHQSLPDVLWKELTGGTCRNWLGMRDYPSNRAANDALATAVGVLVRRAAWGKEVLT